MLWLQLCYLFQHASVKHVFYSASHAVRVALQGLANEVSIPRSVPGLVTSNVLVMTYLEGLPITRMQVSPLACLSSIAGFWAGTTEHIVISLQVAAPSACLKTGFTGQH